MDEFKKLKESGGVDIADWVGNLADKSFNCNVVATAKNGNTSVLKYRGNQLKEVITKNPANELVSKKHTVKLLLEDRKEFLNLQTEQLKKLMDQK